jgi:hypothetical protein
MASRNWGCCDTPRSGAMIPSQAKKKGVAKGSPPVEK